MWPRTRNTEIEVLLGQYLLLVILAKPSLRNQPVLPSRRIRKRKVAMTTGQKAGLCGLGYSPPLTGVRQSTDHLITTSHCNLPTLRNRKQSA